MSDSSIGPLSESVLHGGAALESSFTREQHPTQLGNYRIVELLGEGGMGEVYKAERHEPIRQTVAVKVVKLGMNSREVVARFESERQALAMMDHPGIARVLDAGTTLTGRPYFVMDYVAGSPITVFCDDNKLSIEERLKLFVQVCEAIGHAHTKAILHRDIKASNVLAFFQDGAASVRVIDFGIAKALTNDRLTDLTLNTAQGRAIGTYECMSPEQAAGSPDIDTRTDVYSLGVLLYELLAGAKPFGSTTLSTTTDEEIKRIIREVEPARPSTRLSGLSAEQASTLAERRRTRPDSLARQLGGELEWIPLKAMRKERSRRYDSPLQLKEDVQNYLDGKPLLAGPESNAYRLRKFVSRNRRGLLTALAVAVILLGSLAYYVYSLQAERERTRAALAESERQRIESQKQAAIARDSSNFLANIFRNADPTRSLGAKVTVVEALDNAIKSLDDGTTKVEPLTEAMIRYITGTTLRSLGQYKEALPQLQRARELDAKYRAPDDEQVTVTLSDLALVLTNQGKVAEAEPLFREVLKSEQATGDELGAAITLLHLSTIQKEFKHYDDAERMTQQAIEIRKRLLPPGDPDVASALNNLAQLYWISGRLDKAEPICREVLELRKASLSPGHPHIAQSIMNLGVLLRDQKKYAEAEPLCREALEMRRKALPEGHPDIGVALDSLARVLLALNKVDEAEPLFRETVDIRKAALPAGDPRIADSLYRLGLTLAAQERISDAESAYREALAIQMAKNPAAAPTTQTVATLAALLEKSGRADEAASLRAQAAPPAASTQTAP